MNLLITGRPGSGKSTLVAALVGRLERRRKVGGMLTTEVCEGGVRVGFKIRDIGEEREGVLASISLKDGPRLGRYAVNLEDLEKIGVTAIERAVRSCAVVIIDEIGPMELKSARFRGAVRGALDSDKDVIATLHFGSRERLIGKFGLEEDEVLVLERGRRDKLLNQILSRF